MHYLTAVRRPREGAFLHGGVRVSLEKPHRQSFLLEFPVQQKKVHRPILPMDKRCVARTAPART